MRINLLKKKRSLNHDNEDEWRSATFGQLQSTALPNWLLFSKLQIWKTQQGNLLSRSRRFFLFCLKVLHFIGEHYMDFVVNYIAVYFHGIALNIERKHDNVLAKGWWCDPDGRLKLMFVIVHFNVALCYIVLHCMTWHGGVLAKWWWCACDPDVRLQWTFELEQGAEFPRHCNPHCFLLYHVLPCFTSVLPCTMFVSYFYHCFTLCHSCFIAFNTLHTITSQFTQLQLCIVLLYILQDRTWQSCSIFCPLCHIVWTQ